MNSFLHGFGGGLGRGIGRFIAIIIVSFLIYFIIGLLDLDIKNDIINKALMLNVSAKQQTSTSFNIYTNYDSACGSGGLGYCAIQTNNTPIRRSKGNTYNGVLSGIDFYISYVLNPNYQYSINIYSMSTDFRNNDLSVYVYGFNNNNPAGMVSLNYTYSFVSKSQITINLGGYYNYENVAIYMSGSPLTGVNTYGIRKIELVYDDGATDMSGVIDNQNQNTSDIINNNNSNTEEITNTITNFLGITCKNLFNASDYSSSTFNSININDNVLTLTASQTWKTVSYSFNINQLSNYIFHYDSDSSGAVVYYSIDNSNWLLANNGSYLTINANSTKIYFRFQNSSLGNGTFVFKNLTLNPGTDKTYCIPSTYSSQFDSLRDSQNETNELIKDDSVDNNQANSFFNDFEDNDHGLSSIITLPLSTIQSLTTRQCVALQLPIPFTNGSVFLPCMSEIYQSKAPALYNMWHVVCYGLIAYWIGTDIFKLVKGFKDPEEDKIEVVDL